MRGRHTTFRPLLTPTQHRRLILLQHAVRTHPAVVRRIRLILQVARGHTISAVAPAVGISRRHAYKWLHRWQEEGEAGLVSRPVGRKATTTRGEDHG